MQFFGIEEIIKPLTKTSATIVEWEAGSKLRIGGQGYNITSTLTLDITTDIDTGAVASDTTYYIYAVVVAGTVSLKYSLSNLAPLGYVAHKRIGILKTDDISELLLAQLEGALDQLVFTEENVFSAFFDGDGTLALLRKSEGGFLDMSSSSRTGPGSYFIAFKPGFFSVPPIVAPTSENRNNHQGQIAIQNVTTAGFGIITRTNTTSAQDTDFGVVIHRTGEDYKEPKTIREILGL